MASTSNYFLTEYMTNKLGPKGVCISNCDPKKQSTCNICWWNNITIDPSEMYRYECTKCKLDTEEVKKVCKQNKKIQSIEMEQECNDLCLWFDYHHEKRLRLCPIIQYVLKEKG
jgi:hypothetical protein